MSVRQGQLTWGDINKFETHYDENEKQVQLVNFTVRAETSKVRSTRHMITRGAEYFLRLKKRTDIYRTTSPSILIKWCRTIR